MTDVLTIRGARHRYGAHTALDGVDLTVAAGEGVALLGPNGAGKTTLVGLATGLLARQAGEVAVCGADPRRADTRRRLGVVQQDMGFPRTETVGELVRGAAVRAGQRASAAGPVLAEVGISELAPRRAGTLSGGQQQRVAPAMALVGDPALLLLDEPTVGLDIAARRAFWRDLAQRRDAGVGIVLTTHIVEEAATVADRVHLATTEPEQVLRAWLPADHTVADLRVEGAGLEQALFALTGEPVEKQEVPPFALFGLAVGFLASSNAAAAILNAVLFPMVLASGLWFPLEIMPGFIQAIAPFLPTYHLAELSKAQLTGAPAFGHLVALLVTTAVGAVAAGYAYRNLRV